jgi:hypothetical protein
VCESTAGSNPALSAKPRGDGLAGLGLAPPWASGGSVLRVPVSCSAERSPSGLWRRTGNAVRGNPSRVRIPPSPPSTRAERTPIRALARLWASLTHETLGPWLAGASPRTSGGGARSVLAWPPSPRRPLSALTPMPVHGTPSGRPCVRWPGSGPHSARNPRANAVTELRLGPRRANGAHIEGAFFCRQGSHFETAIHDAAPHIPVRFVP